MKSLLLILFVALMQIVTCSLLPQQQLSSNTNELIHQNDRPQKDQKIVGGTVADITKFPYQLSLKSSDSRHFCGASIVSANYAITAAHCVDKEEDWPKLLVLAGSKFRTMGGVTLKVERVVVHPNYDEKTMNNDIAILKIEGQFQMNERVREIKLPAAGTTTAAGTMAVVSGWGNKRSNALLLPLILRSAKVAVVDNQDCKTNYAPLNMTITDVMLCAGGNGRQDSCQGDSGGPLVANGELVGVVSFGAGCARKGLPGVYTNVAQPDIRNWISTNTNGL